MDIMVRSFLRMSITLRNLAFSQIYRVNVPRLFNISYFHKDKMNQCKAMDSQEDLMLQTLQQGLSPSKLLNYIHTNKNQMKREHVIPALYSLHSFYRDQNQSITKEIDFTKLYTCLKPQIEQLCPMEVIEALNLLQLMNVPSSNIFVTTFLQNIEALIDKLSIQDIYRLSVILEKFASLNLSKSIDVALKNQFMIRISQLNRNDIVMSIYALCFASKHIQEKSMIDFLSETIMDCGEKLELIEAYGIFISLCEIQDLPFQFRDIIHQLQQIVIKHINGVTPGQILHIIRGISSKISMKLEDLYNETLIDKLVQKIIKDNWNFSQANEILSYLNSIRHVQMDLLDYLSAKFYEDPTILHSELDQLQPLITGLALADYKPVFWDVMREPILRNKVSNLDHLKLCYFVQHLACLECFEPMLLSEIFSVKHIMSEEHRQILLRLYQIVKILYRSYDGPWPSKDLLYSSQDLHDHQEQDFPLLTALEQALGGNVYIKTNIRTTLEHFIDHVVIMNRSGYPIAVNSYETVTTRSHKNGITYLEDLTIPPGSQIFLILYAQPDWYARNTRRMLGPYSLYIKTLEAMSYTVIPVNGKMWQKMPDNEKISYIMQAIKLKFENDSISTTS